MTAIYSKKTQQKLSYNKKKSYQKTYKKNTKQCTTTFTVSTKNQFQVSANNASACLQFMFLESQ